MRKKKSSAVGIVVAIIIASVVIVGGVVVAALIIVNNRDSEPVEKPEVSEGKKIEGSKSSTKGNSGILSTDHVRGKRDSEVLVIEYADPQCPGCASIMPKMDAIYEEYKDEVAFVYRHYPISGHQNARSAAIAIEAAGKQGYFWEMLTEIFARRTSWVMESGNSLTQAYIDIFEEVSGSEGDVAQFKKDLSSTSLGAKVDNDKKLGVKDEVSATPTVIVNGERVDFYSGTRNPEDYIKDAIDEALGK